MFKKNHKLSSLVIVGAVVFSVFKAVSVEAISNNVCCVYYAGTAKSSMCKIAELGAPNPEYENTFNGLKDDFACSSYSASEGIVYSKNGDTTADGKAYFSVGPNQVIYPNNLKGNFEWHKEELGTPTVAKDCPKIAGYMAELQQVGSKFCVVADMERRSLDQDFNIALQSVIDQTKNSFDALYKDLVALSSQLCCLPKTEDTFGTLNSSCVSPSVKKEFLPKNLKADTTVLADFKEITPGVTDPKDNKIAKYFYCGAENTTVTGGSQYTLIYRPTMEYCLCTADSKECEPKGYPFLEDKPGVVGCDSQRGKKTNTGVEWKCVINGVSKTTSLSKLNSCLDLVIHDTGVSETSYSNIDVAQLNQLGTVDAKQLIARAIKGILGVLGSLSLVMFIYGGILLMTDRGNSDQAGKAKEILVWTTLGLAVIFAAYAMVDFIFGAFS